MKRKWLSILLAQQLRDTRWVFLANKGFNTRQKYLLRYWMLWNPLSGELEDAMALHQVLKEFREIPSKLLLERSHWHPQRALGISDPDYCKWGSAADYLCFLLFDFPRNPLLLCFHSAVVLLYMDLLSIFTFLWLGWIEAESWDKWPCQAGSVVA